MKKYVFKHTALGILVLMLVIGTVFGGYAIGVNYTVVGLQVRTDTPYQSLEGFGASSAWTYQALGLIEDEQVKEDAIERLYGKSGLALNTFRYNIGAGSKEVSNFLDPLRSTESFFIAENFHGDYAAFSNRNNYDFTRDKGVRDLFERAVSKGQITQVVFFANSPHYLMTENGDTYGSKAKENNLKEECYEAYSDYLLIITHWLYSNIVCKYNRNVKVYISPVNEPQGDWGGRGTSQEGCHYDPETLAEFYEVFHRKIKQHDLLEGTNFTMDIFESANYKLTSSGAVFQKYMKALSERDFFDDLERISAHSYIADDNERMRNLLYSYLKRNYNGISVGVSEYCVQKSGVDPSIDMGLYSAEVIMQDLTTLNAVNWNYWLSVSTYDYENGLVYWNAADNSVSVTKRYYALGHFCKYIEPGSIRVGTEYGDALGWNGVRVAAFIKTDGKLALVVINDNKQKRKIRLDGSYGDFTKIVTDAENNWLTSEHQFNGYLEVGAKSITTFIISQID